MEGFECAVCGSAVAPEDFGYCSVCDWDEDPVQEAEPVYRGGANKCSLNEAKAEWERLQRVGT